MQLDLGRQLLASGEDAKGLEHLRLAIQTRQYKAGDPRDTEVDLFLRMRCSRSAATVLHWPNTSNCLPGSPLSGKAETSIRR